MQVSLCLFRLTTDDEQKRRPQNHAAIITTTALVHCTEQEIICQESDQLVPLESEIAVVQTVNADVSATTANDVQATEPTENKSLKQKQSWAEKFPWLVRGTDGYFCKACTEFSPNQQGPWITERIPFSQSRKLSDKAGKHNSSKKHLLAMEVCQSRRPGSSVYEEVIVQANKKQEQSHSAVLDMFKLAYFLFRSEIPHTTNWTPLVSTAASVDHSDMLRKAVESAPQNAHHLSKESITGILEAFGDAISETIKGKLRGVKWFAVMGDECTDINGREVLSTCIRTIGGGQVIETFISAVPVTSTTAAEIKSVLVYELEKVGLDARNIVAASFDGGSNFSGARKGVQALLKESSPDMIFVHCRAHLLQLALLNACDRCKEVKAVISSLNQLFALFSRSHKRLTVLHDVEVAISGVAHKLVQPGKTRWLSYEGSIAVVCRHFAAICVALEHIHNDAGDYSSVAGGLLLVFRKSSTAFYLTLLSVMLKPLARLSQMLQCSTTTLGSVLNTVEAVRESLAAVSMEEIDGSCNEMVEAAVKAGVNITQDLTCDKMHAVGIKYRDSVTRHIKDRFDDDFMELAKFHKALSEKMDNPDMKSVAKMTSVAEQDLAMEYRILTRLPDDISTQQFLVKLAHQADMVAMFPTFSDIAKKMLLLPIGTASVERSFSAMNRILSSERCRLTAEHVNALMRIAIEGPAIPELRTADRNGAEEFSALLNEAYKQWIKKPRRL